MQFLARVVLLLAGVSFIPIPHFLAPKSIASHQLTRLDRQQGVEAARIAGNSATRAVTTLRRMSNVRRAQLEPDRSTIEIQFRDGGRVFVLPKRMRALGIGTRALGRLQEMGQTRSAENLGSSPGKAIVLEPFASELGLGPSAGQAEADELAKAGFSVDIKRNSDVTVNTMQSLPNYSVVYMETHSGLLDGGDALVVTGESDPSPYAAFYQDRSLQQALVAGDTSGTLYNAITGKFVSLHMGQFPNHSLVFLNGCSVLSAPGFWHDLQSKNVATMVSWDHEVYNTVDELSANFLINDLAQGDTVAGSIQAAIAAGLGTSTVYSVVAHLGFEGDGSTTLPQALSGTLPATATATATATPKATPRPKKKVLKCKRGYHVVKGKCKRLPTCKRGYHLVKGKCHRKR
jgi:hypothetical protein